MPSTRGKSWRRANPRDVLARLIAEHPKAGKRKLKDGPTAGCTVAKLCDRRAEALRKVAEGMAELKAMEGGR